MNNFIIEWPWHNGPKLSNYASKQIFTNILSYLPFIILPLERETSFNGGDGWCMTIIMLFWRSIKRWVGGLWWWCSSSHLILTSLRHYFSLYYIFYIFMAKHQGHFLYIYGQTSRTFLIYLCFHVLTILIENIKDVVAIIEIFLRSFSYSTRPHTIYTCFHALANVDTSFWRCQIFRKDAFSQASKDFIVALVCFETRFTWLRMNGLR